MDVSGLLTVERVRSLEQIDEQLWSGAADSRDLYQSYSWLRALEEFGDVAVTYLIVRQRGRPEILGALPVFESLASRGDFLYWPELHFQDLLLRSASGEGRLGLLVGSCAGFRTTLILDRRAPASTRRCVLRILLDAAAAVAVERGLAYVFFLFLEASARQELSTSLGEAAHFRLATVAQTELEVPGSSFGDYIASLRRNVRNGVRRETVAYARWCSTEIVPLREAIAVIAPMIARVREKHGAASSADIVARQLWAHHSALGDRAKAALSRRNDRIIGASVLCCAGDHLYVTDFGRAENDEDDAFVYFNSAIYEPIRLAYAMGLSRVVTGAGAELGKARRGSTVLPLTHLVFAAGERTALHEVDAARSEERNQFWRVRYCAHPGYFGSLWADL